jgi:hypothetical protein
LSGIGDFQRFPLLSDWSAGWHGHRDRPNALPGHFIIPDLSKGWPKEDLICERIRALGMNGKVTVSRASCLGTPDPALVQPLISQLADLDIAIMTAAPASRPTSPVKKLLEAAIRCSRQHRAAEWHVWLVPVKLEYDLTSRQG